MDRKVSSVDYAYYIPKKPKRRRRKRRVALFVVLLILAAVGLGIYSVFNGESAPNIVDYCQSQVTSMSTIAINNAVLSTLTQKSDYDAFVTLVRSQDGDVELLQANTVLINSLARQTARAIEINLELLSEQGIIIPLGNLTGWPIFAGLGPDITVKVSPNESVICNFISEFVSAGINQTRHKIYLDVVTSLELIMPSFHRTLTNTTQVLIAECVILGQVPEIYLAPTVLSGS